jgi:N-acetylglucosamine-6-phosphate deacetylase
MFTINCAGVDRVVLITDAISATGMPDGLYELGGLKIKVEKGIPKLVDSDSFAGSTLTMDKAFRNIISLGYSIKEAFIMASTNPAKSINAIEKEKIGLIKPGWKADMVILDDDLEVAMTIVNGNILFNKTDLQL